MDANTDTDTATPMDMDRAQTETRIATRTGKQMGIKQGHGLEMLQLKTSRCNCTYMELIFD